MTGAGGGEGTRFGGDRRIRVGDNSINSTALLCALREMRAAQEGVPVGEVPVVQYAFKSRETLTGGNPSPRGIIGFETVKRGRPKGKKTAQLNARVNPRPGHRARPVTQGAH